MIDQVALKKYAAKGEKHLFGFLKETGLVDPKLLDRIQVASKKDILTEHYPYQQKLSRAEYEDEKYILQIELVKLQNHIKKHKQRHIVLFEGRDAAGKGGTIKRFMEHLNPRGARVVALLKPSEKEQGQWYFQRYIHHLPTAGEIVFFDRSWYNRAGVEKVMEFCDAKEYERFVSQCPNFENMIMSSGVALDKFWFSVSREEQLRRFLARILDPLKQWKISPMDLESLSRWNEYTNAKESMFFYTDTPESPWKVIRSDCKKRARLNAMKYILTQYDYEEKDEAMIGTVDNKILGPASEIYEQGELEHRELIVGGR